MIVIIPVHNEAQTIGLTIADIRKYLPKAEVVVVDGCSTDFTAYAALRHDVRVIRYPHGTQYGDCFLEGVRLNQKDAVAYIDAGGSYSAEDLVTPLHALHHWPDSEVQLGSRHSKAAGPRGWLTRLGRRVFQAAMDGDTWADYCSMRMFAPGALARRYNEGLFNGIDRRVHIFNPCVNYRLVHREKHRAVSYFPVASYTPTNTTLRPWGVLGAAIQFLIFVAKEKLCGRR